MLPALAYARRSWRVFGGADAYAIGGASPELVAAFLTAADGTTAGEYYRKAGSATTFDGLFTHSVSEKLTMFDSTGTLVWAPHNLTTNNSEDLTGWTNIVSRWSITANQDTYGGRNLSKLETSSTDGHAISTPISFIQGQKWSVRVVVKNIDIDYITLSTSGLDVLNPIARFNIASGSVVNSSWDSAGITDLGGGYYLLEVSYTATPDGTGSLSIYSASASSNTLPASAGLGLYIGCVHVYRSDLGGMADNPDQTVSGLEKYVPTTSAAVYLPRRNAYYYNGSSWVKGGVRFESAAATQLLHGTDSFATQTETVTAQAYTLQFRGTGSITLSGAHSATLNGTGADDLVRLTFTPSAGTLTLTPSGTVDYPMLETGSTPTSYIPNTAASGTVTRAAETLSIAGADTPANTTAMSVSMKGLMTYADNGAAAQETFLRWYADANNYITLDLDTDSTATGEVNANQSTAGTLDTVVAGAEYSAGVNVAFNIASRHTSGAVNVAKDGTAATADTTPTALADLSSVALTPGYDFNGFISELRVWGADIGDSGIAEVTAA